MGALYTFHTVIPHFTLNMEFPRIDKVFRWHVVQKIRNQMKTEVSIAFPMHTSYENTLPKCDSRLISETCPPVTTYLVGKIFSQFSAFNCTLYACCYPQVSRVCGTFSNFNLWMIGSTHHRKCFTCAASASSMNTRRQYQIFPIIRSMYDVSTLQRQKIAEIVFIRLSLASLISL